MVRLSRKALPKHHMLPALGPAEEGEADDVPYGRLGFTRIIPRFLLWSVAFLLPTKAFSWKASLHGPPRRALLYLPDNL